MKKFIGLITLLFAFILPACFSDSDMPKTGQKIIKKSETETAVLKIPETDTTILKNSEPDTAALKNSESGKININTASARELKRLKGIGPKLSAAVVEHRKKNGNFKNIDEIRKVKGIGPKRFNNIKNQITVE
jgi:comEA protein